MWSGREPIRGALGFQRAGAGVRSGPRGVHLKVFSIRSDAFEDEASIPVVHTGDGDDISPPLMFSHVPSDAVELALICDDPDAPTPQPWVHWVAYKIPARTSVLPAALTNDYTLVSPVEMVQGKNSWDTIGYRGPLPPQGHGTHHYHFTAYALNKSLALPPGIDANLLTSSMEGWILSQCELVGTYAR